MMGFAGARSSALHCVRAMSTSSSEVVLYSYFRSGASYRVRAALNHKGIAYRQVPVNLLDGEQRGDEYLRLNPSGLVPTLCIDGLRLSQSMAIMEYLEDRGTGSASSGESAPLQRLLPQAPASRQLAREIACVIACDTQPIQNLRVLQAIDAIGADKVAWAKRWIESGLATVERTLESSRSSIDGRGAAETGYCVDGELSVADINLVSIGYNAERFGVDFATYPIVDAVYFFAGGIWLR